MAGGLQLLSTSAPTAIAWQSCCSPPFQSAAALHRLDQTGNWTRLKKRKNAIRVRAMFWGGNRSKQLSAPPQRDFVICSEQITQSSTDGTRDQITDVAQATSTITVSVVSSIALISEQEWDACALGATGAESANPFILHAFLLSLEESKSVSQEEGWLPQHLVARDDEGNVLGVVPMYLKSHSYGEYVFDHSWANAYLRYGGRYYPKLQSCVPFTPATGPRILIRSVANRDMVFGGLCKAMQQLAEQFGVSSLHVTFPTKDDWEKMGQHGFLKRIGMQYHWKNRNYKSFDDFLMDLKQSKRKAIRQERKKIVAQNLTLKRLRGDDIKPYHWDAFYKFYRNTTDNKWGQAYLTRDFFHILGSRLGDRVLLVVAEEGGQVVAGALNLIGGDTLYGRNWGCSPYVHYPNLHFETCYYQAIDAAIEWGLKSVEAGAQGEHKIQRGYLPTATYSSHFITDADFRAAISDFLTRETVQVGLALQQLGEEASPFKEGVHS